MSLNWRWWDAVKPEWEVNFYSREVFLLPRLPPCFLWPPESWAELEVLLAPVLFRLWLFHYRLGFSGPGLDNYLLYFCYERLEPISFWDDCDSPWCFWLYILFTFWTPVGLFYAVDDTIWEVLVLAGYWADWDANLREEDPDSIWASAELFNLSLFLIICIISF